MQVGTEQSSVTMSSPRISRPRTRSRFPLGVTRVDYNTELGTRLDNLTKENFLGNNYSITPCGISNCRVCINLVTNKTFTSNVTNKTYDIINRTGEDLNCKSQNVIYVTTCKNCNIQYVGETTNPLHLRMAGHRSNKQGCRYVVTHYNSCYPEINENKFSIQIIEKLEGNGYKNGFIDEDMKKERQNKENDYIIKLRTLHPYGLNAKAKGKNLRNERKISD